MEPTEPLDVRPPARTGDVSPGLRMPGASWWLSLLACVAGAVGVYAVFVASSAGQLLEYQVFHAVEDRYGDAAGSVERLVTLLPPASAVVAGLAALAALVIPADRGSGRRRGALALTVLAGANLSAQVLKDVLPRPDLDNGVPWTSGNSLPSGHMALAISAAVALLILVPARRRPLVAFGGALLTAFTGAAAYLEAWHRPSDMAAAALVGGAWALLVVPFVDARRDRPAGRSRRGAAVAPLLGGAAVLGLAAGSLALASTLGSPAVTSDAEPMAGVAGVLLSACPPVLVIGLVLDQLRRADARRS